MKKILSMVLILLLSLSCFMMAGVSAEDNAFTPSEEPIIYFEVPEIWQDDISKVFCHIWPYDGTKLANWGSKKETCQKTDTENLYSYNISKVGTLEAGKTYCVIFCVVTSKGSELQTYNTLFDTNCFGDTLYCDDTIYENPADSAKTCQAAFWKNQDKTVYGPELQITSIGNIAGAALPAGVTAVDLMKNFVADGTLDNALQYVDKTAEELLTEIAGKLNVSDNDLADIISSISSGDEATADENYLLGDANDDEIVNVKDATTIQKQVAGFDITINMVAADADLSGTVSVKDATAIQKWVAGVKVDSPIGQIYRPQ